MQAPKVRTGKQAADARRPIWLYALALTGPLALVAVILGFFVFRGDSSGPNDKGLAKTLSAAGCTLQTSAGQFAKPDHSTVPKPDSKIKWHTFPPANGPHYGQRAPWNFYDEPVPPAQALHSAEHGGIIIWYGPKVSADTKSKLRAFWTGDPDAILVTPLAGYGSKIAMSAWTGNPKTYFKKVNGKVDYGTGHLAVCKGFDEKALTAFRDTYRGKGPEPYDAFGHHIPPSVNKPGT